jgi:hypothetical protein
MPRQVLALVAAILESVVAAAVVAGFTSDKGNSKADGNERSSGSNSDNIFGKSGIVLSALSAFPNSTALYS